MSEQTTIELENQIVVGDSKQNKNDKPSISAPIGSETSKPDITKQDLSSTVSGNASKGNASKKSKGKTQTKKKPTMVSAFVVSPDRNGRYTRFMKDRKAFSAFTIAIMIVVGMAKLNKASVSKGGKGNGKLLRLAIGPTAWGHWNKTERIADNTLTVKGLNECNARLSGQSRGYDTDIALVKAMVGAIRHGGKIEHKGNYFTFDSKISAIKG